jgi:hypothetical protein
MRKAPNVPAPSPPSLPQRIIAGVGFVILMFAAGWVLLSGLSFDETYAFAIRTLMVVTYLLAIPSFLLVAFGMSRSRVLDVGVRVSTLLALVVLLPWAIGGLQSIAPGSSETAQLGFLFVVFLPWAFVPLALIAAIILAYGLMDEIRINRRR